MLGLGIISNKILARRSAHHIKRKLLFEDQPNGYPKDLIAKHTAGNPR